MENQPVRDQYEREYMPMAVPIPNSTAVLVLGIISIPTCICYGFVGLTCGIIALVLANKAKKLYAANPAAYTPASYSNLTAGHVCAVVGTVLSGIALVFFLVYIAFWAFIFTTFIGIINQAKGM